MFPMLNLLVFLGMAFTDWKKILIQQYIIIDIINKYI